MEIKSLSKEFKIGAAGVVAIIILFMGINFLKGINLFKPSNYYYVKYEDVGGLPKSSAVYANGYRIGIVRKLFYDYDHPGNVTVEVEIDSKMRIPKGTVALLSSSMLGSIAMHLNLPVRATSWYNIGDTIPGGWEEGLTENIEKNMLPKMQVMLPKLDSILTSLNRLLADPDIPKTLSSVRVTADNLAVTSAELHNFMHNDMFALGKKVNKIGDNFISTSDNLNHVSSNLNSIDYAATFAKIDQTMTNVKSFSDRLSQKDNTLGLLLNDSTLYNNLNRVGDNANILLKDLKEHPKRYVHFSIFGKKDDK